MNENILTFNFKGGAGKSTNGQNIASNLKTSANKNTIIEIDFINESQSQIKTDYEVKQIDFKNSASSEFLKFKMLLKKDGVNIIDVGATRIENFNVAMKESKAYNEIDLLIIPIMDGKDDLMVALDLLENVKGYIPPHKIMFSLNRFIASEYDNVSDQFIAFHTLAPIIKEDFGLDLSDENNFYVLPESRAVRYASAEGMTIKALAETDAEALEAKIMDAKDDKKMMQLLKHQSNIYKAQLFHNEHIIPAMEKITAKLEQVKDQ